MRTKYYPQQPRSVFTRFFVVLYILASFFAVLHQDHRTSTILRNGPAPVSFANHAAVTVAQTADVISASDTYCALCDFTTHLVGPASLPQVTYQLHAVLVGIATPDIRPQPFQPFRFFARSASRAPPTV